MIGIDIISIARMHTFIQRFGYKALKRFLNEDEIALCVGKEYDTYKKLDKKILSLSRYKLNLEKINIARVAGFWAAKEACSKSLGVGIGLELGFHDIIIDKTSKNAPKLWLTPNKMQSFGIQNCSLSISHDGGFAIAVVIIQKY